MHNSIAFSYIKNNFSKLIYHKRFFEALQLLKYLLYIYIALRRSSFGPLLDIGFLAGYKGFSLISLGDEPLLGDGYARVFLLHMYMQLA